MSLRLFLDMGILLKRDPRQVEISFRAKKKRPEKGFLGGDSPSEFTFLRAP
jgi:hypothetical protein